MVENLLRVISVNHKAVDSLDTAVMPNVMLVGKVKQHCQESQVRCINWNNFDSILDNGSRSVKIKPGTYPCSVYGYNHNCVAIIDVDDFGKTVGIIRQDTKII